MGLLRKITKAAQSLHDPLYRRALRKGVAPSHEHRAMLQSLKGLRTIVDVGANVGQFALLCSRLHPGAKLHSFEPLPAAADVYAAVTRGQPNVTLHRVALGKQEATLPIHVTARADSSSLLAPALQAVVFPGTHEVETRNVAVMPLGKVLSTDDIAAPALLKIDVQGYEQQVLEGCATHLSRFDWVFVELSFIELYAGQTLAPAILEWMGAQGFELASVYTDAASYRGGRMVQGDFLFHRKTAVSNTSMDGSTA